MSKNKVNISLTYEELEEIMDSLTHKMGGGFCQYLGEQNGCSIRLVDLWCTLHNARAEAIRS